MHLVRISLFLTLFAVALCAGNDEELIGTDSDLVDNVDVTAENVTGENVTNENVTGENVTGENVTGENVTSEDVTSENVTVEEENVTKENDVTKEQKDVSPTRRFFHFLPQKNCACFPKHPGRSTITNVINIPGSHFERLVVYLYKSRDSKQIKVYVPNKERQVIFPDLTYETNDGLNDLNPGAISIISHELGPVIQSWISVVHRPPIDKPDLNLEIISHLDRNKLQSLLIYLKRYKETRIILNQLTGVTLLEKLKQLKLLFPQIYANFMSKVTKFFPVWLSHGTVIRYKPNQLINFPYDINLIPALHGKVIINGQLHYNINELIVYKPPNVDINVYYQDIIGKNIQLNIDSWLNIIVHHINKQLQFVSKTVDLVSLKSIIISILQKNGISITQNGYLVDASGRSVSYTNIILRPILIGESRLVSRIINNGLFRIPSSIVFVEVVLLTGGQLKSLGIIPVGNMFIGLKKVEISTVVEVIETTVVCEGGRCQTVKKCKDMSGKELVCSNEQNRLGNNQVSGSGNVIINSRDAALQPGNNVVIQSRSEPGKNVIIQSRNEPGGVVIQSRNHGLTSEGRIGCPNCVKCGGHHCSSLYDDLESIYEDPHPVYRGTGSFDVLNSGNRGRSGDVVYLDENARTRIVPGRPRTKPDSHVYVVSEDVPGIRIIGGGAATGSGTPLSSKG